MEDGERNGSPDGVNHEPEHLSNSSTTMSMFAKEGMFRGMDDIRKWITTNTWTDKSEPPITKRSLSKLDVEEIVFNHKLRHNVDLDYGLRFRTDLDGGKDVSKTQRGKGHWVHIKNYKYATKYKGSSPPQPQDLWPLSNPSNPPTDPDTGITVVNKHLEFESQLRKIELQSLNVDRLRAQFSMQRSALVDVRKEESEMSTKLMSCLEFPMGDNSNGKYAEIANQNLLFDLL